MRVNHWRRGTTCEQRTRRGDPEDEFTRRLSGTPFRIAKQRAQSGLLGEMSHSPRSLALNKQPNQKQPKLQKTVDSPQTSWHSAARL
ncbi:hypothetical protein MPC4_310035 [Methylocella tundrae]|uniref:Uncharacterized protein n=1 Tax=Methylocella tundrae TaxID=227605 RepID=A0A8B6M8F4_METTU|nr:hypothetical protein MPC1_2850001 [Methylocella tundrae]VTZ51160.1 hypothetical protein MPC4_310035 [Methylocella tundrae]